MFARCQIVLFHLKSRSAYFRMTSVRSERPISAWPQKLNLLLVSLSLCQFVFQPTLRNVPAFASITLEVFSFQALLPVTPSYTQLFQVIFCLRVHMNCRPDTEIRADVGRRKWIVASKFLVYFLSVQMINKILVYRRFVNELLSLPGSSVLSPMPSMPSSRHILTCNVQYILLILFVIPVYHSLH